MRTCDDHHDEIVYEGKDCPLCVALGRILDLEDQVVDLERDLREAQRQGEL